jgi:tetratricopeptide (TPR) repeat protein
VLSLLSLLRSRPWARGRAGVRAGVCGWVAVALLTAATPARATPWAAPSSATLQPASAASASTASALAPASTAAPTTIDGALEAGDLSTAKALAQEARKAEPTAAAWQREGEVLEQAGDYREAAKAYRAAKKAAGEDAEAVATAEESLGRVKASARGTVADEPKSTHRAELDPRWEPPPPKKVAPPPEPEPEPPPEGDRIVTKWYFWVTVGAIAASAAAVAAIAIRAARDDQPDALDSLAPAPAGPGPGVLRF